MLKFLLLLPIAPTLAAQMPDYAGPSILSRGGTASTASGGSTGFRPYVGVSGVYDNALTGVFTDSSGRVESFGAFATQLNYGVSGRQTFRRTTVGLTFSGDFQHFPGHSYFDGTDDNLSLAVSHQLTKRVVLSFVTLAGTYARNYQFATAGGLIDPSLLGLPANELFDNRVIYATTGANLVYQPTARFSLSFGGQGSLVRRRSSALYGVTGSSANADAAYRMSRSLTVAVAYGFNHFDFTRAFGSTNIHNGAFVISDRVSKTVEVAAEAGMARVETLLVGTIAVDPIVAAITGQTSGIGAIYQTQIFPTGHLRISKDLPHIHLFAEYSREITPGNGTYLTSRSDSALLGLSYTGARHWNIGATGGYTRLAATAQSLGTYDGYQGGIGVTRDLTRGFQVVGRVDERYYLTNYASFNRHSIQVTLGFYFSPGDIPLSLW